jgi:hypothetical protein
MLDHRAVLDHRCTDPGLDKLDRRWGPGIVGAGL